MEEGKQLGLGDGQDNGWAVLRESDFVTMAGHYISPLFFFLFFFDEDEDDDDGVEKNTLMMRRK